MPVSNESSVRKIVVDMGAPEHECNAYLQYNCFNSSVLATVFYGVQVVKVKTTPPLSCPAVHVYEGFSDESMHQYAIVVWHKHFEKQQNIKSSARGYALNDAYLFSEDGWRERQRMEQEQDINCGEAFAEYICCGLCFCLTGCATSEYTYSKRLYLRNFEEAQRTKNKLDFVLVESSSEVEGTNTTSN